MGRVLGLDLGERRIGVAVDAGGVLASPHEVLERGADHGADHARIAAVVDELDVERVVVGLPLSLDGSVGAAARKVLDEVDELTAALPVPVETWDERFSTVTADRGIKASGRRGGAKGRREIVDAVAASVFLQSWLDRQSARRAT